jgi:aspartate-semialdehyde dehydrogenase
MGNNARLTVGVVGATGMVGCELLEQLEKRRFPVGELRPFSSGKTRKTVRFRGRALPAPGVSFESLLGCDAVFFVSSDDVSLSLAPRLAARGVWCLDDSAAFRMDPDVPLVIPEVNAGALRADRKLVAGPNCTMTGLAVAGYPLHRALGVRRARISSYQAVSGAGKAALAEFFDQTRAFHPLRHEGGPAPALKGGGAKALPAPIACNVIPQVGRFDEHGHSSEERKVAAELRKIWGAPDMKVSVTAVRVPVSRGHSLSAWLEFGKPLTPRRARALMKGAPGLVLSKEGAYPTPLSAGGTDPVHAGRLRQGVDERELCLWIVSDNLLKGAALNSIQTAEVLLKRRWLTARAA